MSCLFGFWGRVTLSSIALRYIILSAPVPHGNTIIQVSQYIQSSIPCQRTGVMRSTGALQHHENFSSPSRCIFPIRPLLLCERYTSYLCCLNVPPHLLFTKQPNPRKKSEKRESSRPLSMLGDDNQRKVKGTRIYVTSMCCFDVHSLSQRRQAGSAWPLVRQPAINGDKLRVV